GRPGPPGTGLVAVGGFAFRADREPAPPWAGFPGLLMRVPAATVVRTRGRTFVTAAWPGAEELLDAPAALHAPPARTLSVEPAREPAAWLEAVRAAAGRLAAGGADKVVLAREVVARGDGPLSAAAVAAALRAAYPSCFVFVVAGDDGTALVGASPELLVARRGPRASSQPMAGSIARGVDDEEDDRRAAELAASPKDLAEHALVADHVKEALAALSERVEGRGPYVVRFTNIQHLATTVEAELRRPAPGLLALAAALHPTPAGAGRPREAALAAIDELEAMERGWYAGAVGWTDATGDGELAIALRCGLLWEDGARLYAGVGVMPDSEPLRELEETELKLRALLGALG
ncbi:MAG: isochorismate synthase, partial [Candidatus Dormibacterales bacterium]